MQVGPQDRARGDAPDLPVVGDAADADDAPGVRTGVEAVLPAVRDRGGAGGRGAPDRHAADVGQGHRGDGLVAEPLVGADAGGLGQGGEAVQPLAHLPAEAAGAGPVQQRLEQLVRGVPLAPPGRRQRVGGADHAPGRADDAAHQGQDHQRGRQDRPLVPPHELPQPVAGRRRAGLHRLVGQVALRGPSPGRWPSRSGGRGPSPAPSSRSSRGRPGPAWPAGPAPVAAAGREARQRLASSLSRRLGRGGSSSRMIRSISSQAASLEPLRLQRRRAGQQLVEEHAEGVDVGPRVHVEAVELGLLGAHVQRRAHELAVGRVQRRRSVSGSVRSPWPAPKSITLGTGSPS